MNTKTVCTFKYNNMLVMIVPPFSKVYQKKFVLFIQAANGGCSTDVVTKEELLELLTPEQQEKFKTWVNEN